KKKKYRTANDQLICVSSITNQLIATRGDGTDTHSEGKRDCVFVSRSNPQSITVYLPVCLSVCPTSVFEHATPSTCFFYSPFRASLSPILLYPQLIRIWHPFVCGSLHHSLSSTSRLIINRIPNHICG
ncbi:hypothetical protein J6590_105376, partial [Homalodisca vitripennis]